MQMATHRIIHFTGGASGEWAVTSIEPIIGQTVAGCARLAVH